MHPRPGKPDPHPRPGARPSPLLDLDVLAGLEAEIPGAGHRFASAFVDLWEQRYARISAALQDGHPDEALDAVLSLKVSAAMVGGRRLANEAASMEIILRSGGAGPEASRIRQCGQCTVASIRRHYLHGASMPPHTREGNGHSPAASHSPHTAP
ncbi:Hpt domain-containing protein [Sinomonas sp. RB5]